VSPASGPPTGEQAGEAGDGPAAAAPTVALVLGSGGARGYAHIGVIQALREAEVEVVSVAGASMGALVGGLLAAGKLDEFTDWTLGLGQLEVLRLIDLSLSSPGAIRGEKVFAILADLLGGQRIEELPIDYTAVAVDLLAHREVWFREGPLDVAIRASAAIPSFFVPVTLNGRVLVDGGVLNPVPVAPVAASRADRIVAVSLNGRGNAPERPATESAAPEDEAEWSDRLRDAAARWFDSDLLGAVRGRLSPELQDSVRARLASDEAEEPPAHERAEEELRTIDIVQTSLDAMQAALARHRLAAHPPDLLISVPKSACRILEFHRAREMIDLGRRLAEDALPDLIGPADPS
jgi:NTE family protein